MLRHWLNRRVKTLTTNTTGQPSPRRARRRSCTPTFEILEYRTLLASQPVLTPLSDLATHSDWLNRVAPEAMKAAASLSPGSAPALDLRRVFFTIASSASYWKQVGGTPERYRAVLAKDLLGGRALPPSVRNLPVGTRAERRQFLTRLMQTDRFCAIWVHRLAGLALQQDSFTPPQMRQALRLIRQPGGFRKAITFLLSTPQVQAELQRRAVPPSPAATPSPTASMTFTVGESFVNPYLVNRQSLVPDPVPSRTPPRGTAPPLPRRPRHRRTRPGTAPSCCRKCLTPPSRLEMRLSPTCSCPTA
jgi:hypothetical protein